MILFSQDVSPPPEKIILVSGNGDFHPPVKKILNKTGVVLEIWSFKKALSSRLSRIGGHVAPEIKYLDDHLEDLKFKRTKNPRTSLKGNKSSFYDKDFTRRTA